jgi:hypothetical protein
MLLNPIPFLNFSVSPKSDADIQKPADIPIGKNKIDSFMSIGMLPNGNSISFSLSAALSFLSCNSFNCRSAKA